METRFDLAGRALLVVAGAADVAVAAVAEQMDPFPPGAAAADSPAVHLHVADHPVALTELQRAANDSLVTATDGSTLRVVVGDRSCSIPNPPDELPAVFNADPGFPIAEIVRPFVKPALQLAMLGGGSAAVHASSIERDGRAVMVAGWSESGKTETALALLEEAGSFLSDKWTVIGGDGSVSAFPMSVGVRRWMLPYAPRLRRGLPARHRLQLRAAGAARAVTGGGRRQPSSLPGQVIDRAVTLGERAGLRPSELRAAYGQQDDPARRLPLHLLIVLTTVPTGAVTASDASPDWAARRLAASASYERRTWYSLAERARYLNDVEGPADARVAIDAERELLARVLDAAKVVEVKAPYPVDPRRITDAVTDHL